MELFAEQDSIHQLTHLDPMVRVRRPSGGTGHAPRTKVRMGAVPYTGDKGQAGT